MKRINSLFLLGATAILFIAFDTVNSGDMLSTGAPPAHTGAPGEQTCARSGCHTGTVVNSGAGVLTMVYNGDLNEYVPGETYEIRVSLDEIGITRFGFELTAISDISEEEAGSLVITDSTRMQVMQGPAPQEGRKYITYKYAGTIPVASGKGEWVFDWTAPSSDIGPVSFYVAAVSANDDATDDGDLTYTTSLQVLPGIVSSLRSEHFIRAVSVYPNPATEVIHISTDANFGQEVGVSMYTISGQLLGDFNFDGCCSELDVAGYESGTYIMKVVVDGQIRYTRLIITQD